MDELTDRQKELNEFVAMTNALCKKYDVQFTISITDLKLKDENESLQKSGAKSVPVSASPGNSKEVVEGIPEPKEPSDKSTAEKEKEIKGEVA
jgi:hypothetical protein